MHLKTELQSNLVIYYTAKPSGLKTKSEFYRASACNACKD